MGTNRRYAGREAPQVAPRTGGGVRHVWVRLGRYEADAYPGLVVEWRRESGGWVARVAFVPGEQGEGTLVEQWVEASRLRPAP
ncbi:hypothetical protein CLV56_3115 [Mumia flava]|uniref:Uncharacterized protein n=1 Tax=Mumia flava TaxID=1348852 RepID=A0A2M9B6S2_9ACTN|nr:hypothetical protein [Mumia flava]PJJ53625.1 hypothetical protein CLV56_3115 [Mumia flava]